MAEVDLQMYQAFYDAACADADAAVAFYEQTCGGAAATADVIYDEPEKVDVEKILDGIVNSVSTKACAGEMQVFIEHTVENIKKLRNK